jgi:hypothetical protein
VIDVAGAFYSCRLRTQQSLRWVHSKGSEAFAGCYNLAMARCCITCSACSVPRWLGSIRRVATPGQTAAGSIDYTAGRLEGTVFRHPATIPSAAWHLFARQEPRKVMLLILSWFPNLHSTAAVSTAPAVHPTPSPCSHTSVHCVLSLLTCWQPCCRGPCWLKR